jgi:hypothetical protein
LQAFALLINDSTGVAVLKGSTKIVPSAQTSAVLQFTDLRIDVAATSYRVRIRVFSQNATELTDVSGENGVSGGISVAIGDSKETSARSSLTAVGNGSCVRTTLNGAEHPAWNISIQVRMNRANYFQGFRITLSAVIDGVESKLSGPMVILSHNDQGAAVTISSPLVSERNQIDTICSNGTSTVSYEIYSPGGYYSVDVTGIDYWSSANGRYEPSSFLLHGGRPVYKQVSGQNYAKSVTGMYAGIYGLTEYLYGGLPTFRLDGGGRFLRTSFTDNTIEVCDELGGPSVGTISSGLISPWSGFHILIYDDSSSRWAIRRFVAGGATDVEGDDIVRAYLSAGQVGWSCAGCRTDSWQPMPGAGVSVQWKDGGSWVNVNRLQIRQQPIVVAVDGVGNLVSVRDTAAHEFSMMLSQTSRQHLEEAAQSLGAQIAESFMMNGEHYTVFAQSTAGAPSYNVTNASDSYPDLSTYAVNAKMYRWSSASRLRLHVINNGNLRGNGSSDACPSGWTCTGTVSGDFNRSVYAPAVTFFEPPQCVGRAANEMWQNFQTQATGYISLLSTSAKSNLSRTCSGAPGLVCFCS